MKENQESQKKAAQSNPRLQWGIRHLMVVTALVAVGIVAKKEVPKKLRIHNGLAHWSESNDLKDDINDIHLMEHSFRIAEVEYEDYGITKKEILLRKIRFYERERADPSKSEMNFSNFILVTECRRKLDNLINNKEDSHYSAWHRLSIIMYILKNAICKQLHLAVL